MEQKSSSVSINVSSLRPDCLNNLRVGNKPGKTHLLSYMSQCIEDNNLIALEEVQELCCYDRMKNLLQKDKQSVPLNYENKLSKAIHIEAKINTMERQWNKIKQEKEKENISDKVKKGKSYYTLSRKVIIDEIKNRGFTKLINLYKNSRETSFNDFKNQVQKDVQNQVIKIMDSRDSTFIKLVKENKALQRQVLLRKLQIQQLKSQVLFLRQDKSSEITIQKSQEIKSKKSTYQDQWHSTFEQYFPGLTVEDVKNKLETLTDKCLMKLKYVNQKIQSECLAQKKVYETNILKLKDQIKNIEQKLLQSMSSYKQLKEQKELSTIQSQILIQAKKRLQSIQNFIFQKYNEWYGQRTQNQKIMLKQLGYLKQDYNYQEMLRYMIEYKEKFSTNDNLNDFIIKMSRGVQKLRKIIFPKQTNNKLKPLQTLEDIQHWVKLKVKEDFGKTTAKKGQIVSKVQNDNYLN